MNENLNSNVDTSQEVDVQPQTQEQDIITATQPDEPTVDLTTQQSEVDTPQQQVQPQTQEEEKYVVKVGGEELEVSKDELLRGYQRQADYTRKTQYLSQKEKEMQNAVELYEYLRQNPHLAQRLVEEPNEDITQPAIQPEIASKIPNPNLERLDKIEQKLYESEIDTTLNQLKNTYGEQFNDVDVLNTATELGIRDLGVVSKYLYGDPNQMNILKEQIRKEVEQEITQKLQTNANVTQTIMGNGEQPVKDLGLSEQEKMIAVKMGMTPEEYAKFK